MPISVDLGKPLEEFVDKLIAEGRYGSKSEVLREGARLVQEREAKLAVLDTMLDNAINSIDSEKGRPISEAADEIKAKLHLAASDTGR